MSKPLLHSAAYEAIKLSFVGQSFDTAACQVAKDEMPHSDFLEALLREKMAGPTAHN